MEDLDVQLWVGDQDDVLTYTVAVDGGIHNTDEAVQQAIERAQADGYEDLNLKGVSPASGTDQ
jgi:L-alanine-DL-glutamate epimerase-like enolase superfamily enzyme